MCTEQNNFKISKWIFICNCTFHLWDNLHYYKVLIKSVKINNFPFVIIDNRVDI